MKQQYLDRFDELIAIGDDIFRNPKRVPGQFRRDPMTGVPFDHDPPSEILDWPKLVEWRTKSATLLSQLPLKGGVHDKAPAAFLDVGASGMEAGISILRALRNDFERGFLDNLLSRIEAELAADYMGQAEKLLGEGMSGQYDHVQLRFSQERCSRRP